MPLKWELIYSVNVKEIDEQHKKMFALLNRFFANKKSCSKEKLGAMIKELQDYADYHLSTEEKYFKKFDYPEQKSHVEEHDQYRKKIAKFAKDIHDKKNNHIIKELDDFLSHWWLHHIQKIDARYSDFFNQHGLF